MPCGAAGGGIWDNEVSEEDDARLAAVPLRNAVVARTLGSAGQDQPRRLSGTCDPHPSAHLDGKSHPGGIRPQAASGTQGILIGLSKGEDDRELPASSFLRDTRPTRQQGGPRLSIRKQVIHFDGSSKVGFVYGGAKGKISPSANAHPGGVNLGFIWFELPAGQASGK